MKIILLVLTFSVAILGEPSTDSLGQLQKQAASSAQAFSGGSKDLIALDALLGKFKDRAGSGADWTVYRYPSAEEIARGIKPRIQLRELSAVGTLPLVPTAQVRGIKRTSNSECVSAKEFKADSDNKCSEIDGLLSCVKGKKGMEGEECKPSGGRGTTPYIIDSSRLGAIETLEKDTNAEVEQTAFVGIPAVELMDGASLNAMLSDTNSKVAEDAIASVMITFKEYVPDPVNPELISGLKVQVGSTLAIVPIDAPPAPTCRIKVRDSDSIKEGEDIEAIIEANSIVSSATLFETNVVLDDESATQNDWREIGTIKFKADPKALRLTNIKQIPQTDNATGVLTISGFVSGPDSSKTGECLEEIELEFYKPQVPACTVQLAPENQEEGGLVDITVIAYNTITAAKLITPSNPLGAALNFSPAPTPSAESRYETRITKSAAKEEVISAWVSGPGGETVCSETLFWSPPKAPACELTAAPPQIEMNKNTSVTLKTLNRVNEAVITTPSEKLPVKTPYTTAYFDVFEKASYTVTRQVQTGTTTKAIGRWIQRTPIYKTVTDTVSCACGEKVIDRSGVKSCSSGGKLVQALVGKTSAEALVNSNPALCARENKTKLLTMSGDGTVVFPFKRTLASGLISAVVKNDSAPEGTTCSLNVACPAIEPPACTLSLSPVVVRVGEEATASLSCSGNLANATARIDGRTVTLSTAGTATQKVVKIGKNLQDIIARVEVPSTTNVGCPARGLYKAQLQAAPPCRFIDPEYKERLSIDVSKFNSTYSAYKKASFEGIQLDSRGRVARPERMGINPCRCGQVVAQVPVRGRFGGYSSITQPACVWPTTPSPVKTGMAWGEAEDYQKANPDLCLSEESRSLSSPNEVIFPAGRTWDLLFQHKVTRTYELKDKEANTRQIATYNVPSNDNWLYSTAVLSDKTTAFNSEADCDTGCKALSIDGANIYQNGDLCLSQSVSPMERVKLSGKKKTTYVDSDAVCESEQLNGQTVMDGSVSIKATPGKYENWVYKLGTSEKYAVEQICKANHLCVVETTPRSSWNVSDTFLWVEVGPINDANCHVTRIDTAISVRDKGCFAPSTKIRMANGSEKEVQEIRSGDYVWNPHYRMGLRVKKVAKGPEKKSLFAVFLGKQRLDVTQDHPFYTGRGWVQAIELQPGDLVFGEGSPKKVTETKILPYNQPVDVWNFELDTEDPMAHVVIANGIPTGDLVTQLELKKIKKELP